MKSPVVRAVVLGLVLVTAACSHPTLDATSHATIQASLEKMTADMTREQANVLASSVAGIYMISSLQGILHGKTEAEIEQNIHNLLHGKNAAEILATAQYIRDTAKTSTR